MSLFDFALGIELIGLTLGVGLLIWALHNKKRNNLLAKLSGFLILMLSIIAFTIHHFL